MTTSRSIVRAAVLFACFILIPSPVLAGKLYRCADGSFQDKPCVEGGGTVVGSNRRAPRAEGDKICVEAGKRAEQIAQSRVGGVALEQLLADIDAGNEPYERRLEQKKQAVQVYQDKSSPLEARVVAEADCVAGKSKAVQAPSAAAAVPAPSAAPRESGGGDAAAVEARRKADADAARRKKCDQYQAELAAVRSSQRDQVSIRDAERLNVKKRDLDQKVWETCG
jgi:hypothetical protein